MCPNEISKSVEQSRSNKIVYIQFMRAVACFLVIVNHTWSSLCTDRGPSFTWFVGLIYFFICKIAVPLFLMISGALLLTKTDTSRKSAERICRGAGALVAASAIYYAYYGMKNGEVLSIIGFCKKMIQTNITNALWYLYLYLGLLCLLPVLQKMVKALEKKDIQWVLFLSVGVLGTVPLAHIFIPSFGLSGHFTDVLFSTYIGMLLCGYYVERYVDVDRKKFWVSLFVFVLLIGLQVVATYYLYQKDPGNYLLLDNRNFLTVTGSTTSFYIMVKYLFSRFQMGSKLADVIAYLGELSFGIYLLSDLMIRLTLPVHQILRNHVHVILAMGIWELLVFIACAIIVAGLKQIPFLKKWL